MRIFAQKQKPAQEGDSVRSARRSWAQSGQGLGVRPTPRARRIIGDELVERQPNAQGLAGGFAPVVSPHFGHDFSRISVRRGASARIGPTFAVEAPECTREQQANLVAEQVIRMPEPQPWRGCTCDCGYPKCDATDLINERRALGTNGIEAADVGQAVAPPIVHDVLRFPGHPLDSSARAYFEPRFAYDFSQVRVHVGEVAAKSALAVSARAYTVGRDIVFGAGQYRPGEGEGRRLLAHELTHVCQQSAQSTQSMQRQGTPPPANATPSDAIVQQHIDGARAAKSNLLEAWIYLRDSRCLPQNCGDQNLAAAEHYMFARYLVEDDEGPLFLLPPDVRLPTVLAAIAGYSLWKLGFQVIGSHAPPLFCPQACLVTPTSVFQVGWASTGAVDGNIATFNRGPVK